MTKLKPMKRLTVLTAITVGLLAPASALAGMHRATVRCNAGDWSNYALNITAPPKIGYRSGDHWLHIARCQVAYAVASEVTEAAGPNFHVRHRQRIVENGRSGFDAGVWTVSSELAQVNTLHVTARQGPNTVRFILS